MNSQRMIHDSEKMIKELKERIEEADSELELELYVLIGDRSDDKPNQPESQPQRGRLAKEYEEIMKNFLVLKMQQAYATSKQWTESINQLS